MYVLSHLFFWRSIPPKSRRSKPSPKRWWLRCMSPRFGPKRRQSAGRGLGHGPIPRKPWKAMGVLVLEIEDGKNMKQKFQDLNFLWRFGIHNFLTACIYIYICVSEWVSEWMNEWMHECMNALHECMYACMHVCMYACMHVFMYVCMHVCMFACMHVCMYACIHVCMYACMHVCMQNVIENLNSFVPASKPFSQEEMLAPTVTMFGSIAILGCPKRSGENSRVPTGHGVSTGQSHGKITEYHRNSMIYKTIYIYMCVMQTQ